MSTRSYIAIENDDDSVSYIYCHWDGYLAGVGVDVVHMNRDAVKALVERGDCSTIEEPYSDRGEETPMSTAFNVEDFKEALRLAPEIEYAYLLGRDGKWKFCHHDGIMCSLTEALASEGLLDGVQLRLL